MCLAVEGELGEEKLVVFIILGNTGRETLAPLLSLCSRCVCRRRREGRDYIVGPDLLPVVPEGRKVRVDFEELRLYREHARPELQPSGVGFKVFESGRIANINKSRILLTFSIFTRKRGKIKQKDQDLGNRSGGVRRGDAPSL